MHKVEEREYRSMSVLLPSTEKEYIVEGYATTFDEPYVLYDDIKEVIDRHAFDECDMSDVILQLDHAGRVYARTRNSSLYLKPDGHGLFTRGDLGLTSSARALHEDIKAKLIDRMSFGFSVRERVFDETTKTIRITKIKKLYDVSCVSIPANPGTEISARTREYIDGEIERIKQELQSEKARKIEALRLKIKLCGGTL